MNCHRCGDTLPTNARGCPRCDSAPSKTKKLSQTDLHKTRALVQLERCGNCGWMVYPSENECSACGTWINRPWKQNGQAAKPPRTRGKAKPPVYSNTAQEKQGHEDVPASDGIEGRRIWVGIGISVAVIILGAYVWRLLFGTNLQ